jgi:hypothetical protein
LAGCVTPVTAAHHLPADVTRGGTAAEGQMQNGQQVGPAIALAAGHDGSG